MEQTDISYACNKINALKMVFGLISPSEFILKDEKGQALKLKEVAEIEVGRIRLTIIDADGNVLLLSFDKDDSDHFSVAVLRINEGA